MNPKEINIEEKCIKGIGVRTRNEKEMNSETAKLPGLWQAFYQQGMLGKIPGKLDDSLIYGIYYSYESDLNGEYSVIAGVEVNDVKNLDDKYKTVKIEKGQYLVFEGKGEMPNVVIDTWKNIWEYFSSKDVPKRAYATDFELYKGPNEVEIYIGIAA